MKVDESKSRYQPVPDVKSLFDVDEERHCRAALRRAQYLEVQNTRGGDAWAEREEAAIVWLLRDAGFLQDPNKTKAARR